MTEENKENQNQEEENFEQLLKESFALEKKHLSPGEKIEAPVVSIGNDWTLLGIGGKGEGFIATEELKDKEGNLYVSVGDVIRAYFLKTENGEMHFTTQVSSGPAARTMLHDAMEEHIPLEGTISKAIKGGFEVTLSGGARAFCPFSHMGIRRDADKEKYVGQTLNFYVIEVKGRSATLSRKEIVEAEHEARVKDLKETLNLGDRVHGVVTSIPKKGFGAFIDFGGVEGLLPISEIAWERTAKVEDVLKVGQEVDVVIKSMDWDKEKVSLSLRETLQNPWDSAAENFPVGSYHTGKVCRIAQFGAFISLAPTIDGLIHISKLSGGDKKIQHPQDVLKVGQEIEVKVEKIDLINKRISLIPADLSRAEDEKAETITRYTEKQDGDDFNGLGALGEALKKAKEEKEGK